MTRVRRVVTGLDSDGRSTVLFDDAATRTVTWSADPASGPDIAWLWATEDPPVVPGAAGDLSQDFDYMVPAPGGVRFAVQTCHPGFGTGSPGDAVMGQNAGPALQQARIRGFVKDAEPSADPFHATDSVEFMVILSGEIWLVLEEGREVQLAAGDCLIQTGVIHAWQNRSDQPCTYAYVMVGAHRTS